MSNKRRPERSGCTECGVCGLYFSEKLGSWYCEEHDPRRIAVLRHKNGKVKGYEEYDPGVMHGKETIENLGHAGMNRFQYLKAQNFGGF